MLPPLFDVIQFCEQKGYDVFISRVGNQHFRAVVFKGDKLIKTGMKLYSSWKLAQEESYKKLYNALK